MRRMKWINKTLLIGIMLILSSVYGFTQDHVLISEVVLNPYSEEFIELYNPTGSDVDLSQYHLSDFKNYYEITSGGFTTVSFADFCVGFPDGTNLDAGAVMVIAVYGDSFEAEYGIAPDFEIYDTDGDDSYTDMAIDSAWISSNNGPLGNTDEMLILFKWDGVSDVVQDVDYLIWGDKTDRWVDKSTIGSYFNDTPVSTQFNYSLITSADAGYRILRDVPAESGETLTGGNGLTGHDETSEHFSDAFLISLTEPNPGTFGFRDAISGDGFAQMSPATTEANLEMTIDIKVWGDVPDPLTKVSVTIPQNWNFSQGNVSTSGDGFTGSSLSFDGNNIIIENTSLTGRDSGMISIANTFAEGGSRTDTFKVATSIDGETPVEIAGSPTILITPGTTPISEIQENEAEYLGQTVKIRGVVVIGSGVLRNTQTNVYIADDTGAGIEIFNFTYEDDFKRGDSIEVTGVIGEYSGVTQIADYTVDTLARGVDLPRALSFTTGEMVADTDTKYEGYWIKMTAPITDKYYAGGGWNIKIDDGSGEITIRAWDTSNLDLASYNIDDSITVKGIETIYNGPQLSLAYQEDIRIYSLSSSLADGSGTASASAQTVVKDSLLQNFKVTLVGNRPDTIAAMVLTIPYDWDTTNVQNNVAISGDGIENMMAIWKNEDDLKHLQLEGLQILEKDSLEVTFSTIKAPGQNLISTWHMQTAGTKGTLSEISIAPQIIVGNADSAITPIYDVQRALSLFTGNVTLEGVVTIGVNQLRTGRTSAYMQDASGFGINISDFTVYNELVRGAQVRIKGNVSDYNKVTQIDPSSITVLGQTTVPEPKIIPTNDINSPKYDGTFVKLWGVVTDMYSTAPGDYNLTISDGTGPAAIRIWGTTGISPNEVEVGEDAIWVSGVGGVYSTADADLYQLLPAYEEDFVIDPNYEGSLSQVDLDLPPYPFVPDMGEQLKIKFNAGSVSNHTVLRIFDLQGRVVKTLFDEDVTVTTQTINWDGKDQYGRNVDLGTYICHLEVVINRNGKHKVKIAPIVVGTKLK